MDAILVSSFQYLTLACAEQFDKKPAHIKACVCYFLGIFFLPNDTPLKTMKCFLFHLKSSFRSRDI